MPNWESGMEWNFDFLYSEYVLDIAKEIIF